MDDILSSHEFGEGLPVLVIHGWQSSSTIEEADFEPIFAKTSGLHRLYVDLPGCGSTPANNVQDLDDIYHRLVHFIDSRIGTSKFLLIGSSCGAYFARALAQKYSHQVDGLLFRVPVMQPTDTKRDVDPFIPLITNEEVMAGTSAEGKAAIGNVLIQTPAYVEALERKYTQIYLPASEATDVKALEPIRDDPERYRLSASLIDESAKFFAPTLMVCGRHDDNVGYRDCLRLLEVYPRASFVVLDRGTHAIPLDEADVFEALVRDWVVRVEEWRLYRQGSSS